jgi:bla regulator protein blaR1
MNALIAIAIKSLLVAGVALLMLRIARGRSAGERSLIAHAGLLGLILLPLAPLIIPALAVEAPALLGTAPAEVTAAPVKVQGPAVTLGKSVPATAATPTATPSLSALDLASFLYWIPAGILLSITLIALGRLLALRARAEVLVDANWLSALARAQKRMGFKHGTALLTSDDLPSPISWGLMRPVILLNSRAVDAADEAEAIIAHELAHVARLDWAKLLLARIATALFWFNPLVWILAREAHQLREEAADDSVLAANIIDTDYAQLLVGIARHECRGLLLGAHGVAPSKSSLARRVARVLDAHSPRGPVARSFGLGVFVGAMAMAAPLAALTLTPKGAASQPDAFAGSSEGKTYYPAGGVPLPSAVRESVGDAVGTAVNSALASVQPIWSDEERRDFENEAARPDGHYVAKSPDGASIETRNGRTVMRSPGGAIITIFPPDAHGRRKVVMRAPNGAEQVFADARQVPGLKAMEQMAGRDDDDDAVQRAIQMKALNVTPAYAAEMRAAAPNLGSVDNDDLIEMRAVGVTPDYVRDLASVGMRGLDKEQLVEARAVGVTGNYVRSLAAAGFRGSHDDYVQLRAVGVTPHDVALALRKRGGRASADDIVELKFAGAMARPERPERPERHEKGEPPEPPEPPEADDS